MVIIVLGHNDQHSTMEEGFDEIESDCPLVPKAGTQFFLIRLPKDVDVSHLHGRKVHIDKDKKNNTLSVGSKTYNVNVDMDAASSCSTLRPIVTSQIQNSRVIGPSFAGIVKIEQTFRQLETQQNTEDIPITAYRKLQQVPGLTVRSMPRGSYTSIEDLQARKQHSRIINASIAIADEAKAQNATNVVSTGVTTTNDKKKQKQKHSKDDEAAAAPVASSTIIPNDDDDDGAVRKKQKKSKKDKS